MIFGYLVRGVIFKENGRNPLAKNAQRTAGNDFRTKVSKNMIDKWKKNNPNATSTEKIAFKKIAEKKAKDISSSLAALHNPDNVLGGYNKPVPTKMGNPSINSSVGRQSADRVGEIDDYLEDVLKDETKNDTMNLELKVCKKKDCSE